MKNKSSMQIDHEPLQFHKDKKLVDPFKLQYRVPGVDIPGFGKHYPCQILKGQKAKKPGPFTKNFGVHHDPCFWNRGGGRWFHTKRRGGQLGRQRERGLPRVPFSG